MWRVKRANDWWIGGLLALGLDWGGGLAELDLWAHIRVCVVVSYVNIASVAQQYLEGTEPDGPQSNGNNKLQMNIRSIHECGTQHGHSNEWKGVVKYC